MPSLLEAFGEHAEHQPNHVVFCASGVTSTWRELHDSTVRSAAALHEAGIGRGELIPILLPTSLDCIVAVVALQRIGAVPVVMDHTLPPTAVADRLQGFDCHSIICSDDVWEPLASTGRTRLGPPPWSSAAYAGGLTAQPHEVAYCQFTSGTTGDPKLAAVSHRSLQANLTSLAQRYRIDSGDVLVSWLPLHHDFGLVMSVFGTILFGSSAHLLAPSMRSIKPWMHAMTEHRATFTISPDFGYRAATRLVKPAEVDLSTLRFVISGGEPARVETAREFEATFDCPDRFIFGYGMAETTLGITGSALGTPPLVDTDGNVSNGPPLQGVDLKVVDADLEELPIGETGEILVQGASVFDGYWQPDGTVESGTDSGWWHTGDTGRVDADGNVYVLGRKRAMINRAGEVIPASTVERAAETVPSVVGVGAIGSDNLHGSEDLVVIVEVRLRQDDTADSVIRNVERVVRDRLGFAPKAVLVVRPNSLPRTSNGKLRHAALRDAHGDGSIQLRAL